MGKIHLSILFILSIYCGTVYGSSKWNPNVTSIKYLEDSFGYTYDRIAELKDADFIDYRGENMHKDKVYWLKIKLENKNFVSGKCLITFNSTATYVALFQCLNGFDSIYNSLGGAFVPLSERTEKGYLKDKVSFIVNTDQAEDIILYIKIKNDLEKVYSITNIDILSEVEFLSKSLNQNFKQGCFIGMILILLVLNLILFLFSGNRIYLYYALYSLLIAVFSSM